MMDLNKKNLSFMKCYYQILIFDYNGEKKKRLWLIRENFQKVGLLFSKYNQNYLQFSIYFYVISQKFQIIRF